MDAAARQFSQAYDAGLTPIQFVNQERQASRLIMGIGHRIKSITNPDKRVQLLSNYVHEHFVATPVVDYALEVEKVTTNKVFIIIITFYRFKCLSESYFASYNLIECSYEFRVNRF